VSASLPLLLAVSPPIFLLQNTQHITLMYLCVNFAKILHFKAFFLKSLQKASTLERENICSKIAVTVIQTNLIRNAITYLTTACQTPEAYFNYKGAKSKKIPL
jgi:hypothetical protein